MRFPEQGNMTFGMYGDRGIRYREYMAAIPFQGFPPLLTRESSLGSWPIIVSCITSERYSCSINSGITLEDLLVPYHQLKRLFMSI
jgi:hypothetical protein